MAVHSFSNTEVAQLLREVAAVLEVKGESRFRIRAYDEAATVIEHLTTPLQSLATKEALIALPGIGASLAEHLVELFQTGSSKHFDSIRGQVPAGVFALLEIPEVGPKTAFKLATHLSLDDRDLALADLKTALERGKLDNLEGIGDKTRQQLLQALTQKASKAVARLRVDVAHQLSQEILVYLQTSPLVLKASALGSLRRRQSTIGDIDLGVATEDPQAVEQHIRQFPQFKKIISAGDNQVRFVHQSGLNVDVKLIKPQAWGSLLQHFTGSKAHNIHLRELALKQGLSLSEHGIKKDGIVEPFKTEEAFYQALKLDWIPPELREDQGEIEAAGSRQLPKLVELSDIKGDFHTHTNYKAWASSHDYGQGSVPQLLDKAQSLGYQYLALGDHNPSLSTYSEIELGKEVLKRRQVLEKVAQGHAVKALITLEVDIKPDGNLALPDQALMSLDFVVASVHSAMHMDRESMTKRVLKAMSHPKVKILGHPTGRLINKRSGYELDWSQIFTACKQFKVALEINANPVRLDIDAMIVREAIKQGVLLTINTDVHGINNMDYMQFGVNVARRGWAEKKDIINTWEWGRVKEWLTSQ